MNNQEKKVVFFLICFVVIVSVLFIFIDTIYKHVTSFSKGVVHWHAGVKITICGEDYDFAPPKKWYLNKVGNHLLHHHDDMRIHVEGIVENKEDVFLGEFFDTIGVEFTDHSVAGIKNGNICPNTRRPGSLKMFVNGQRNYDFRNYLISPYFTLEEEDKIELIFD